MHPSTGKPESEDQVGVSDCIEAVLQQCYIFVQIGWTGYQPVRYTSDEILQGQADYADPDIMKM